MSAGALIGSLNAACAADPFDAVPRPRGRDLTGPELERFVAEVADRPELWIPSVRHDATRRVYEEIVRDEHLAAWLICWMGDHDTGFHDHDGSAGAVAVVGGSVDEARLTLDGGPSTRRFRVGETFHFSPAHIHSVRHAGTEPAVTIHVYSPPLERMGAYAIDEHGLLIRKPLSCTDELRPLGRVSGGGA